MPFLWECYIWDDWVGFRQKPTKSVGGSRQKPIKTVGTHKLRIENTSSRKQNKNRWDS